MSGFSEVEEIKGALKELVEAHEGFDRAAFDGNFDDIFQANTRLEKALQRAKLAKKRFESTSNHLEAFRVVRPDCPQPADLERCTQQTGL